MRNPLARLVQRDPAKPSLRERMAATKVRAKRILGGDRASSAAVAQPDPHLAYLAPLLQAHAERHAARPIDNITHCPKEEAASLRVSQRLWRLQDAVLHLPAPKTPAGLSVLCTAFALSLEAALPPGVNGDDEDSGAYQDERRAVAFLRSVLGAIGADLPEGFTGFGDEPGFREADRAPLDGPGSLPAWALAEEEGPAGCILADPLCQAIRAEGDPQAQSVAPKARNDISRDLYREAFDYAYGLDIASVTVPNLLRLYDVFSAAHLLLDTVSDERGLMSADSGFAERTAGGVIVGAEANRLGCLRDVCVAELRRRAPAEKERDYVLETRIRHEMLCEGKIRDRALLAEINAAWGA